MTLPTASDGFRWTEESWGAALRCEPLEAVAPHLFATRQLAFTDPGVLGRLGAAVGAEHVSTVTQVHGSAVVAIVDGRTLPSGRSEADALVSNVPDTAVVVRVADCVPLLMGDARTGAVAAVHAGWRGTKARVAVAAIEAMGREFGTRPADLIVAIGPSIGACCYEVGTELVDAFAAAGHERHLIDRWFLAQAPARGSSERHTLRLDVAGANRDQLVLAGVPDERIHLSGLCTAMHLDVLTSFRAEKEQAGRMAAVIRAR